MYDWRIECLGDAALLLRLGDRIDSDTNRRVHAIAAALRKQAPTWLIDTTPAYASLSLHVEVGRGGTRDPLGAARDWLETWLATARFDASEADAKTVEIPVLYGAESGPDLVDVAAHAGISAQTVIERHAGGSYTVAMLGFAPGFPYLLGLDPILAMPRLASPRMNVAAGSVGIGGAQTGIYPDSGPGGWRLIGRTPLRLFDPRRASPSLLHAGDKVRFIAIDAMTFAATDEHLR